MRVGFGVVTLIAAVGITAPSSSVLAADCIPCAECDDPRPEDTLICACFDGSPGVVGSSTVAGDSLESVSIPIMISTADSLVDSFVVDFEYPMALLRYDSTSVGDLTAGFQFFDSNGHPMLPLVRVIGFEPGPDPIPAGTVGNLAILHFTVIASGCASTCPVTLLDDLRGYLPCFPEVTSAGESQIVPSFWGRIKSAYRTAPSP